MAAKAATQEDILSSGYTLCKILDEQPTVLNQDTLEIVASIGPIILKQRNKSNKLNVGKKLQQ